MAKNFNIFVVHGFKSNCDNMKSTNGYLMNDSYLSNVINGSGFNWRAGPEDNDLDLFLSFFIDRPQLLRTLRHQWENAWGNIPFTAGELSNYVCEVLDASENKHVVLVGHSLGAELIRRTIPLVLARRHAIIDIFIMAGVSNKFDYQEILTINSVRSLLNIYSRSDMVLKFAKSDFVEHGDIYDPMGLSEIKSQKAVNIEVNINHSQYNDSGEVEHYFKMLINNLLDSPAVEY